MKVEGSAVLLTGASTGIGAATARALGAAGARIGIVARRKELLEEVAEQATKAGAPEVRVYPLDLGDLAATDALAEQAWNDFGALDGLVNNAAIASRHHATRLTVEEVERVTRINYLSPIHLILRLLPKMRERGSGTIINVASTGGRLGILHEAAYCGAKFGLTGFSEVLYADLKREPINVHVVQPGPIETPIWNVPDNEDPLFDGPFYPPEVVADDIVATLRGEKGFEIYSPEDMKGVVDWKNSDVQGFLDNISVMDAPQQ